MEDKNEIERLQKKIAHLQQENEVLRHQSTGTTSSSRSNTWRKWGASVFIISACVITAFAVTAVWLNRQVVDTDAYVETVAPLSRNKDIQSSVSSYVTNRLFTEINVERLAREALPPRADFLASPLVDVLQNFVRQETQNIVASEEFNRLWIRANRKAHETIVGALTGERQGALEITNGKVALNLEEVAGKLQQRLEDTGIGLFQRIPLDRITGDFTILESGTLSDIQGWIQQLNRFALILPLAVLALFAAGIAMAPDRRKAMIGVGVGLVLSMAALRIGLVFGRDYFLGAVPGDILSEQAAGALFDTLITTLLSAMLAIFTLGLLVALGAILMGPSASVIRIRSSSSLILQKIGPQWDFGPAGAWIAYHKTLLRITGLIASTIILGLLDQPTAADVLFVALGLLVYLGMVEFFGRETPETAYTKKKEFERKAA